MRSIVLGALLAFASPALASGVAVVDFQRAVNETTEGKGAQERLDTMYSSRKAELERMKSELEREIEDFEARALILSDSARREAEQKLTQKQSSFQEKYVTYEQEMQQTYYSMLEDLDTKMRAIVDKIAKEKGYDIVIDKAALVYVGPGALDITSALIQRYNSGQ